MSFVTYPQQLTPAMGNPFPGQYPAAVSWNAQPVPWSQQQVPWTQLVGGLGPHTMWGSQSGIGFGFNPGYLRQTVPGIHSIAGPGVFGIDPVTAIAYQQAAIQQLQRVQQLQQLQELQQLAQLQQLHPYAPLWQQSFQQFQPQQPLPPQLLPATVPVMV